MASMFEVTLANWPPAWRLLSESVSEWFMFLGVFHKLTIGFAVVGVINGVFMQETFKISSTDDNIMLRQKERSFGIHARKMRNLFEIADSTGDGMVDLDEFRQVCEDKEIRTWLASMELDYSDADRLFFLLDNDNSGAVNADEIMKGVARLKGTARSIDLLQLAKEVDEIREAITQHFIQQAKQID